MGDRLVAMIAGTGGRAVLHFITPSPRDTRVAQLAKKPDYGADPDTIDPNAWMTWPRQPRRFGTGFAG
jgi:hypothetical protein